MYITVTLEYDADLGVYTLVYDDQTSEAEFQTRFASEGIEFVRQMVRIDLKTCREIGDAKLDWEIRRTLGLAV